MVRRRGAKIGRVRGVELQGDLSKHAANTPSDAPMDIDVSEERQFFIVAFACEEIMKKIVKDDIWYRGDHPLFRQPWNPNFDPTKLRPYEEPLWIRLYNLPVEYWGDECLEKIGRTLGTPIDIDWDILESDLGKSVRLKTIAISQIPQSISLIVKETKWCQSIEIETDRRFCTMCRACTHFEKDCNSKVKTKEMWQCKKTVSTPRIVGLIEVPKNEVVPRVTEITPPLADPNTGATCLGTSIPDIPCQISAPVEGNEGTLETRMRNLSNNCSPPQMTLRRLLLWLIRRNLGINWT
ncbi:hypothetical protein SUGI_0026080 [Cryptomeria japonica]|nr:hypothetical protein SUGI_0026080 [Cryptomeria japonica]